MKLIKISAIWCPSCLVMEEIWQKLQKQKKDVEYVSLDYDIDEIDEYNVGDTLPVIILVKGEKELKRFVGEVSVEELIEGMKLYEE